MLAKIYDGSFHVDNVNFICKGIEILQTWAHSFDVFSEPFIDTCIGYKKYRQRTDRFVGKDIKHNNSMDKWSLCFHSNRLVYRWTLDRCLRVPYFPHSFQEVTFWGIWWAIMVFDWNQGIPVVVGFETAFDFDSNEFAFIVLFNENVIIANEISNEIQIKFSPSWMTLFMCRLTINRKR